MSSKDRSIAVVHGPLKGRGTNWQLAHRFERDQRESYDDGWGSLDQAVEQEQLAPHTEVIEERVKSILAANDSPDVDFDLSINPYRGCEHVMWRDKVLPDPGVSPLPDFF